MRNLRFEIFLSFASFIVAIVALIVAIQSNNIAKEASTPKPEIREPTDERIAFQSTTCYTSTRGAGAYHLLVSGIKRVTVVNNGGRTTSLLAVKFSDSQNNDYMVSLWKINDNNQISMERLSLPIALDAGKAESFYIEARNWLFSAREENDVWQARDSFLSNPLGGVLFFYFSDGQTISNESVGDYYLGIGRELSCDS